MEIMTLADFFSLKKLRSCFSMCSAIWNYLNPDSKLKISLLHAPDYMILTPKLKNLPIVDPPPARSLRSLAFDLKIFSVFSLKSEIIPHPHF